MTRLAGLLLAVGTFVGAAQADTIVCMFEGTIETDQPGGPGDPDGLDGASMRVVIKYDDTGSYAEGFGIPWIEAIPGTGRVTISGAPNAANNATVGFTTNLVFFPMFAGHGTVTEGGQPQFISGDGANYRLDGNTLPTPGSADAVIGSPVELDDWRAPLAVIQLQAGSLAFGSRRIRHGTTEVFG